MTDRAESADRAHRTEAAELPGPRAPLPVPAPLGRGLVLGSVFVCAACGLVYELELVALATYLSGDSVTQASVVLSVMVFAMGVGSLLAKRLRCRAAAGFGLVEALLALIGGGSAMALYASFAWLGSSQAVLVGFSFVIGVLIGAEMPLLMTLIQRIRSQDAGGAVADLFAADYVGGLVGGLMFPFLLLPLFGQLTGALVTGVVNVAAGGVIVLWLFGRDLARRTRLLVLAVTVAVLALLLVGTAVVGPFEEAARRAVYGGTVRVALRTDVQEVIVTGSADPEGYGEAGHGQLEYFLDGRLRLRSGDEARYHESLVHPAMDAGPRTRVLVLGGGDGMALREVLRHPDVARVDVVELDAAVTELARTDPGLSRLNDHAFDDPRVRLHTADAFDWLRARVAAAQERFDVVVSDLPDPAVSTGSKLYSQEFYGLAARALAPDGRLAAHVGAAGAGAQDYWTAEATMRAAGLSTEPYVVASGPGYHAGPDRDRAHEPGPHRAEAAEADPDWGFLLARHAPADRERAAEPAGPTTLRTARTPASGPRPARLSRLRAVTASELAAGRARAERARVPGLPPSSLTHPRYGG
ncbi:polyamine aminopropyltransferase [Streptomyces sp. HNM0574]|uniref:polyamine aminopropyltransferase n=1 Tax=Streptomyces sp. HNM0574 TaxID=2714954 RepID=UPI00146DDF52|nr:polyamine aminopropyltransferase [Streptomyces sp. HNM0574]NLU68586.1 polyamine aminopropyltransferase [Streptomyces sp. HNM0574]